MSTVHFITHPEVEIDPSVPVPEWRLSAVGVERAARLLHRPWVRSVRTVFSSAEPKAMEVATMLAAELRLTPIIRADLGENDRSATGYLPKAEFEAMADAFFSRPDESVAGWERAVDAQGRIVRAVDGALSLARNGGDVAIVAHGGVGALLLCHLKQVPISRAEDQPGQGGGNVFSFDSETRRLVLGWRTDRGCVVRVHRQERTMAGLDGPRWGPASKATPKQLVVLCHGLGADGHDLIDLAPTWSHAVPDALFVSVDAPFPHESGFGRQWWSVEDRTLAVMEAGVRRAAGFLDAFIDAELARLGLPAEAYALMGFSQGAMTALFTGLRRATAPRAILAFSGALVAPETLAAELANRAPVLIVHGEADDVVPAHRSRDAETALRAANVPVEAVYVPRLGHGIDDTGLSMGALALQRGFAGG